MQRRILVCFVVLLFGSMSVAFTFANTSRANNRAAVAAPVVSEHSLQPVEEGTPTETASPTETPTVTATDTATATVTATATDTATATATSTVRPTATSTATPTQTIMPTSTIAPTATPTVNPLCLPFTACEFLPYAEQAPTPTPTPLPTDTPLPTATATSIPPTPTKTPVPTRTPVPPTPTRTPIPTKAPAILSVKSSSSYYRSTTLYVVGEVFNNTANDFCFVKITARFYDAGNNLVATTDGYTAHSKTERQALNPFRLFLSNAPTSIVRTDLTVTANSCAYALDYRGIRIVSQQVRDNYGVEVFGELTSDVNRTMRGIEAVATFYDANGTVVEVDSDYVNGDLATGVVATYQITTFRTFSFTNYRVSAQGYVAP